MNNIGQRIKELRKKNDLTQERLADYLGVTYKAVSKWECGLTAPDLSLIIPLARILKVSADELLCGKQEEIDERRVEFDQHCDNHMMYDPKENYQMALRAVNEYPMDYKYLSWLALCEMTVAYCSEYKEDPTAQFSQEMMEIAIKHNDVVIENCEDSRIKGNAIWNAMVCCKNMDRYEEAKKYAEMFPTIVPLTRDNALELCLQGNQLISHRQRMVYKKLSSLCVSLSRIYWFAVRGESYVTDALDTEETILQLVIPDKNYLGFHKNLCALYQKRAEFEIVEGNHDKAVAYLQVMLEHAEKIPNEKQSFTCGILDGLSVDFSQDIQLPYILQGLDDLNKPIFEQLKNRIMTLEIFSPLWEREDFKSLVR